jgi:transposase InsO family protein
MEVSKMNEDEPARWAQFRFSVIAPLVCRTLNEEQRKDLKQEILNHKHITPDGHEKYIPRRTLNEWLGKYKKGNFAGLFRSGRTRNNTCTTIAGELLVKAEELRREDRARSIRIILSLLQSEGFDISDVSKSTLNWHLNRRGLGRTTVGKSKGTFQRWEQKHVNALWQADTSSGIWLPDPINPKQAKRTRLISFIDDASRICTHAEFYFDEQLPNLVDCFRKALLKRGKPQRLLCDNAFIYHSNTIAQMCAHLGIEPSFCRAYSPESKGKVERKYGTFKSFFYREAEHAGLTTLEELNRFFWAWLTKEYHHVKHSSINMAPGERWRQEEQLIRRVTSEEIRHALMLKVERTVNARTAIIRLENKEYQAGIDLAGAKVEVRWDVGKDEQIEVWKDNKLIQTAPLFKAGTNIDFRRKPERVDEPRGLTYASSKRYRQALVAQHEGEKPMVDDYLSQPEFSALVAKLLEPERVLEAEERASLEEFFFEHSPLPARKTEILLTQAVSAKGTKLHVRFYLQHIRSSITRR